MGRGGYVIMKFRERREGGGGDLHTMFMVDSRLNVVDGRIRHSTPLKYSEPFVRGARPRFGFDEGFEGVAVGDADAVGVEARVGGPGGFLEFGADDAEEAVVAAAEEDVAVEGFEGAVGDDGCWVGFFRLWVFQRKKGAPIRRI